MSESKKAYKIGFLGTIALVGGVLVFMYATTFEPSNIGMILSAVMFYVVGLAFAYMMVGLKFELFNFRDLAESLIWTAISVVCIWIINKSVPFKYGIAPLSDKTFSILMGGAEESFFRVWLCTFIDRYTKQAWLAIGVSSLFWSIYHFSRYGGSGAGNFLVILLAGCVLGWVILASKRGDGVIFAHSVVNYLA